MQVQHVIEHVEVQTHAERAMREHAHREYPREACGLLAAALDHHVLRYVAMTNMARGQADYAIDPVQFADRERQIRRAGLRVCGFFHSHPDGEPTPSRADHAAAWPPHVQLILGMHGGAGSQLTAWYPHRGTGQLQQVQLDAT